MGRVCVCRVVPHPHPQIKQQPAIIMSLRCASPERRGAAFCSSFTPLGARARSQCAGLPHGGARADSVSKLTLINPPDLLVVAADWAASPALAAPGGAGAGPARLRRHLAEISFLSVDIPGLEIRTGPRAAKEPWAAISLLVGALGPVGTNAARLAGYPASTATVVPPRNGRCWLSTNASVARDSTPNATALVVTRRNPPTHPNTGQHQVTSLPLRRKPPQP